MIDIDALMKRMNETGQGETICLNHDECEALLILLEEREERIAIMAERPIAHWVDDFGNILQFDEKRDSPVGGSAYCSNCGEWLIGSDEYSCHGSFCPHCGAEMKGKPKEGDSE